MDKRTLELLHSKLSDLDNHIAEISSLRQQIFDILKEHESKQQAEANAAAIAQKEQENLSEPKDAVPSGAETPQSLAQLEAEVDEAVRKDEAQDDEDPIDTIGNIDSLQDVQDEAEKAKEEIEREAISLEAEKLMESAPDDVEPMRQAEESLQDDINGQVEEDSNTVDMVNNPETISTIDPTIIPEKVLDEDLDVGKDSDLAKVDDAFAEMDRIEPQQDIDKMEEDLSQEHNHSDLVAPEEKPAAQEAPEVQVHAQPALEDKVEEKFEIQVVPEGIEESPVKEKGVTEIKDTVASTPVQKTQPLAQQPKTSQAQPVEEEPVIVQPRPIQQNLSQPVHPSNEGTINVSRPSSGMKVDEMLSRQNSRNLYKAFTLNDKFRFRRELFHGQDIEMASALDRISLMDNFSQAEDYFYETLGLNPNNEDVKDFMMIIKNHFA